jgi:phenylpropionate dioxygenase-like ring-hydroxylating dioxygenase large terminal subunit
MLVINSWFQIKAPTAPFLPRTKVALLVRNSTGVELLSNVCRHRQALMLNGSGQVDTIVCPLHRWTYDLEGQLLGRLILAISLVCI